MGDVKKYATYLETVGKTPLVVLHKVLPEAARHATVVCKLEMQNPGGSIKDRIAVKVSAEQEKKEAGSTMDRVVCCAPRPLRSVAIGATTMHTSTWCPLLMYVYNICCWSLYMICLERDFLSR